MATLTYELGQCAACFKSSSAFNYSAGCLNSLRTILTIAALCGNGLLPGVYVPIYRRRYPGIGKPEAIAARVTYVSFTRERIGNYWIPH